METKKLNQTTKVTTLNSESIPIFDANGKIYYMEKQAFCQAIAPVVGGLIGNLGLFPFMYRGMIDQNSNFNSLPYDGWYKMEGCGISLNGPGIEWGILVNITTNGHYKFQIATNNNNTIRIRLGDSNFREWKTISLT